MLNGLFPSIRKEEQSPDRTALDPTAWGRVCSLFETARVLDPDERETFLGLLGTEDPSVRETVERMLVADDGPNSLDTMRARISALRARLVAGQENGW